MIAQHVSRTRCRDQDTRVELKEIAGVMARLVDVHRRRGPVLPLRCAVALELGPVGRFFRQEVLIAIHVIPESIDPHVPLLAGACCQGIRPASRSWAIARSSAATWPGATALSRRLTAS